MKLLLISDLNMGGADSAEQAVPRSGYANISLELCRRLTTYGHEVKILEANAYNLSHEQIKKEIERYVPDFVALTGASSMMDEIKKLCNMLPKNVKVIF